MIHSIFLGHKNPHQDRLLSLSTTQMLQSFSFYGVRSLLVLYLTHCFFFSDHTALSLYGNVMSFVYIIPFLGGLLINRYFSPYSLLCIGIILIQVGICLLIGPSRITFYLGLTCFILGQGLSKSIIPLLLDLYYKKGSRRTYAYNFYYVMLNIGAGVAPFLMGFIEQRFGFTACFSVCLFSSVMTLLLVVKVIKQEKIRFTNEKWPQGLAIIFIIAVCISFLLHHQYGIHLLISLSLPGILLYFGYKIYSHEQKIIPIKLLICLFSFCLFVALFEQAGGSLLFFIERYVYRKISDFTIPASVFLSLNSFLLVLLQQLSSRSFIEYWLHQRSVFTKMSGGFMALGTGFLVLNIFPPHMLSLVITFSFHALGELLIIPTILSALTQWALPSEKGLYLGFWGLAVAYGHLLAVFLAQCFLFNKSDISPVDVQDFQTVFSVITAIAFTMAGVLLAFNIWIKEKKSL